jgi:predicted hydrolase (HD superfamily)
VGGEPRSVGLVEAWVRDPGNPSKLVNTPSGPTEHTRLTTTETKVNQTLRAAGHCAGVAEAAALWRSSAAASGMPAGRYVLFKQAGRSTTSDCARVLVNSPGGGGPADVYAAELP